MLVQHISASQYEHACRDMGVGVDYSSFVLSKGWVKLTNFEGGQKSLETTAGETFYFDGIEWKEGKAPAGLVPRTVTFIVP